ncbi:PSTK family protein [Megaselia abdita]
MAFSLRPVSVIAVVGLPGAGKTTFCEKITKENNLGMNIVHFCFDTLFPWSNESNYKENRNRFLDLVESSVLNSREKTLILVDDNNYYQSMRYKIIQLCRKVGISFGILYFPLTLEKCLIRNHKRQENRLPEDVIKRMFSSLETPLKCFHFIEGTEIEKVLEYFEDTFKNPLTQIELTERAPMTQSQIHIYDLHLRKLISARMKDIKGDKKLEAEKLNRRRKTILENLRNLKMTLDNLEDLTLLFEN